MRHLFRTFLYSRLAQTQRALASGSLGTLLALAWSNPVYAQTPEDVAWHSQVSTTAAGSTLTRTGGAAGWNSDAISIQSIPANGYFEFKFDQTNKRMAAGVSYSNTSSAMGTLDYAVVANASTSNTLVAGNIYLRVDGTTVGGMGSFVVTDVFRIERTGTIIKFYKNGVVIHTVAAPGLSIGGLVADTSFYDLSGSISACKISSTGEEESIVWDRVGAALTPSYADASMGSRLTHSTTTVTAGARSARMIAGDGYAKFRIGTTARKVGLGFAATDPDSVGLNATHGIEATGTTNNYRCFDPSGNVFTGTYAVTDTFTIRRIGGTVSYLKNDAVLATSATPITSPVFVDVSLHTASGRLESCRYSGVEGEPIDWTGSVGVDPDVYNSDGFLRLTKWTANSAWDAGIVSVKRIERAGQVDFRFGQTDKQMVMGLSLADSGVTQTTVQFGIAALGNGTAQVMESGVLAGSPVAFTTADRFAIRRSNQTMFYEKNGVVFHQRSLPGFSGTSPLLVDTSFFSPSAEFLDPRIHGAAADVSWRALTSTLATAPMETSGSKLAKTATGAAWNAGAISETYLEGDGALEFSAAQTDRLIVVGLNADDVDTGSTLSRAIVLGAGTFYLTEQGVSVPGTTTIYNTTDVLRIERIKGVVNYYKNGTLLHTSPTASTGRLFVDTAFHAAGNAAGTICAIHDVRLYAAPADSDGDGMGDAWEYQHFTSLDSATQSGGLGFENDKDRDGISNVDEFLGGTNPTDYYNGVLPDLRIVSGDHQESLKNQVLPQPLVIEVRDDPTPGAPLLPDAPVVFSIQGIAGTAGIGSSSSGPFSTSTSLLSGSADGQARVWLRQPNTDFTTTTVRVTATSQAASTFKEFKAYTSYFAAHWKFDDDPQLTGLADSSPTTPPAPGNTVNQPAWVEGLGVTGLYTAADRALSLDGVNDHAVVTSNTKLQFTQKGLEFTITAWVQLPRDLALANPTDFYPIASKWTSGFGGLEFGIKGGAGNGLAFRIFNNSSVATEVVPATDQRALLTDGFPHLVACARDSAGTARLYIDGNLVGTLAGMTGTLANSTQLRIGRSGSTGAAYFKGTLDDVRLWAFERKAADLLALRQAFDSDSDGLPDAWEQRHFSTLAQTGASDTEGGTGDGLNNTGEFVHRTNPTLGDTDEDGLADGFEVVLGANPTYSDSDGDGISDGDEHALGGNPVVPATEDTAGLYLQITVVTPLE